MVNSKLIAKWGREHNYRVSFEGSDSRVILVGESHTNSFIRDQLDLITRYKPAFVLHELAGARRYDPKTQVQDFVPGTRFGRNDAATDHIPTAFIVVANQYKFQLIGIGLSPTEWYTIAQKERKSNPREEFSINSKRGDYHLERRMAQRITDYLPQTSGDLIVIAGMAHLTPRSQIYTALREKQINHVSLLP